MAKNKNKNKEVEKEVEDEEVESSDQPEAQEQEEDGGEEDIVETGTIQAPLPKSKEKLVASNIPVVQKAMVRIDGLDESAYELVKMRLACPIRINGDLLQGVVVVPRHMAQTIFPMVQGKIKADIEIFTGKNVITEFLTNGDRIFKEGTVDPKK